MDDIDEILLKYIVHCENDLNLPISELDNTDKLIYIMYNERNYNYDNISMILKKDIDYIKKRIKKLNQCD
jgi:hypothetical protein